MGPLPDPWTFAGTFGTFSGTFEPSLEPLEPSLEPLEPSLKPLEPSLEPSWTWPGSAPKPLKPSPGPCPQLWWIGSGFAPWLFQNLFQNLPRNLPETDLALRQSHPDLLRNCPRNLLQHLAELDLALHHCLPWPSPNTCWIWSGSAPKPPRPSLEHSEPSPEPPWTWRGACTSAHRSYPGPKTPWAANNHIATKENPALRGKTGPNQIPFSHALILCFREAPGKEIACPTCGADATLWR